MHCIRKAIINSGISSGAAKTIIDSWRPSTIRQYEYSWRKYVLWCVEKKTDPFCPLEKDVIEYLNCLKVQRSSYSVINTAKSMLTQTLSFFGVDISSFKLLERMMKGCFNDNPPKARYSCMWDVGTVFRFFLHCIQ